MERRDWILDSMQMDHVWLRKVYFETPRETPREANLHP